MVGRLAETRRRPAMGMAAAPRRVDSRQAAQRAAPPAWLPRALLRRTWPRRTWPHHCRLPGPAWDWPPEARQPALRTHTRSIASFGLLQEYEQDCLNVQFACATRHWLLRG